MIFKLTINTPPNKAGECIESNKKVFLGKLKEQIIDEQVLSHNQFYWRIALSEPGQVDKLYKKCATGEALIKEFYKKLFSTIKRTNNIANELKKAPSWIRKRITRMMVKKANQSQEQEFQKQLDNMTDDDFIYVEDEKEMKEFLSKTLITITQEEE